MASPKLEVFVLFDSAGAPLPGQTGMTFAKYTDDLGGSVTPQPSIVDLGGGAYGFVPNLPVSTSRGLVYVINTNGANPAYFYRYVRPEEYAGDSIPSILALTTAIRKIQTNHWKIYTSGGDANKLVIFDDDGTTPLYKFALTDSTGTPTSTAPFERSPTS